MIDKPLNDVGVEDLQRLQANGVPESRSLDYKQMLPGSTDDDRKEFLADVSSFANTAGGDLVYGVAEVRENGKRTGVPERIDGLSVTADAEALRLENMLRDGIAPRLAAQFKWVTGFPQGPVLIIRVPRSWAGPHMVIFKQHSRFYARNAGGKYALDVFQIRQAFLGSGSLRERAREFRAERLGRIGGDDTPVQLEGATRVCVHIIPHAALAGGGDIDLLLAANQGDLLEPFAGYGGRYWNFNLDGFVTFSVTGRETRTISYLQIYRNGTLETVSSGLVHRLDQDARLTLLSRVLADELDAFFGRARRLMRTLVVESPASLFVSILGARGAVLGLSEGLTFVRGINATPFDRDSLLFRDLLLIEWEGGDTRTILKPLMNEIWQAAGLARCFDYDDQGNWKPSR